MLGLVRDWRQVDLTPENRALCAFAEQLTVDPASHGRAEVEALRSHGFDDAAIHDAAQAISYFNYINRIADALGVEPEAGVRAWESGAPGW
ncbi:MAG: hypothetical protein AAF604_22505 [Acidobacteriota bacterium]